MADRKRATSRAHRDASMPVAPARVLRNFVRLLHDGEKLMDRHMSEASSEPLDAESFAMGVMYATLFLYGNRPHLPTTYIAEMIRAGAIK